MLRLKCKSENKGKCEFLKKTREQDRGNTRDGLVSSGREKVRNWGWRECYMNGGDGGIYVNKKVSLAGVLTRKKGYGLEVPKNWDHEKRS